MPTVIGKPPALSTMPGLRQLPTGAQQLMDLLFPPDAVPAPMPMTTIGPNAIPLSNWADYVRRAVGETLGDIGDAGIKYAGSPQTFARAPTQVKDVLGRFLNERSGVEDIIKRSGSMGAASEADVGAMLEHLLNIIVPK